MKSNCIVSFNMNTWLPVDRSLSYERKINNFSVYVKQLCNGTPPKVICLQEVIAGKGQIYLEFIKKEFSEYEVITPVFDFEKHYKSIMSVTLIRKDILNDYTVNVLDDECLPNRVNYVVADIEGVLFRIINLHVPQIVNFKNKATWYIDERKRLNEIMWKRLEEEAKKYKDVKVLIVGDFQESSDGPNIAKLKAAGYGVYASKNPTVDNIFFLEKHIDHIIFSDSAIEALRPITLFTDSSVLGKLSDHCILYAVCTN
ncbi:MAG: hypothetical protein HDQ97_13085 [Lachnospiraceae bacterium]|nr:hypothetical protein [Lachnospiraceae bacterium]